MNSYDVKSRLIELSNARFQHFEINSNDFASIYESDPGINFYNEIIILIPVVIIISKMYFHQ